MKPKEGDKFVILGYYIGSKVVNKGDILTIKAADTRGDLYAYYKDDCCLFTEDSLTEQRLLRENNLIPYTGAAKVLYGE